ncbi:hypothetical protein I7I50_00937 [Histoplasma capsulatum G186AR]|uniref:Uncharacterized protein n=1 Tax=Ajellomyces capsulatus TaxID=5037 RepID=A0A8H7YEQ5_AJECA|nr:hypothetical protein I7I52_08203 [Histoplasma capsulatum]QSS72938.1 hypothetical protein I7I50_00937 [Histoplasma capsulatum G186AR]
MPLPESTALPLSFIRSINWEVSTSGHVGNTERYMRQISCHILHSQSLVSLYVSPFNHQSICIAITTMRDNKS